jgi:MFS superfamily sulfate permease-like transporter
MTSPDSAPPPPAPSDTTRPLTAGLFAELKHDLPASIVVFLVALPLCLGIALASGAPLLSGLITGIVGGIVVALASGSPLAVSGPAAGLAVVVLNAITSLGSYEAFLLAVVLAGALQIVLGALRAGIIGWYFPASVIRGLLAAIGALLILKQVPHALGIDTDYMGDTSFLGGAERNTFDEVGYALGHVSWAALIVSGLGLAILFGWDKLPASRQPKWLRAPLLVVALGIAVNALLAAVWPDGALRAEHLVQIPSGGPAALVDSLRFPDLSRIGDPAIWIAAGTLAIVASLETLLSIEAMDKLDPFKRTTPTNRELVAQGVGNIVAGAIGGLPMTAVIVRGTTNVHSGARTKASAFFHGIWLLLAVLALPALLNRIPLAALAAVLLHVGYKLSPLDLFKKMYRRGWPELLPFLATFFGILFTDLLKGVGIGMAVAIFFILKRNLETPYFLRNPERRLEDGRAFIRIELSEDVSFLNKASVIRVLQDIPKDATVEIDGSRSCFIHPDVIEVIDDFRTEARLKNIQVELIGVPKKGGHVSAPGSSTAKTVTDPPKVGSVRA